MEGTSSYGLRVKSSLEKLNVPAWYRDRERAQEHRRARHESGESTRSCRSLGGWRSGGGGGGGGRGWSGYRNRDSDTGSQQTSRDNSRSSTPAPALARGCYTRWSTSKLACVAGRESRFTTPATSPAHSSYSIKSLASGTSTHTQHSSYRQPYLGWRSQEQLGRATSTGTLVTTPAQRLANSSIRPHSASSSRKKVTVSDYGDFYSDKRDRKSEPKQDNSALHESIKQVTVAIDDFCKSSKRSRKPLRSRGTYEGLLESKQLSSGGHLWMESSFLPTKTRTPTQGARVASARARLQHYTANDAVIRLEDQIF